MFIDCLGPFLASNVSCISFFLFLRALVLRFFFTNFFLVLHIQSCLLVFRLCFVVLLSFFLFKLSVSILFLIVGFCILFCMVFIDSLRIVFMFSIDGSSSLRVSNLFSYSILKGVANFSNTLRSNLSGFCFWIFFSLISFVFISTLALAILWSLPISLLL